MPQTQTLSLRQKLSAISDRVYKRSMYRLMRHCERFFIFTVLENIHKIIPPFKPLNLFGIPNGIANEASLNLQTLYPETTYSRTLPRTVYKTVLPHFKPSSFQPDCKVGALNNAICHQKGAIFTAQGKILPHMTVQYGIDNIKENRLFRFKPKNFFPKITHFPNTVAWLAMDKSGNFCHWFFDILTRFALFEKVGFKPQKIYVKLDHPFQKESLKILGYSGDQIIDANQYPFISAHQLYISTTPCSPGTVTPWMTDFFMKKFQPAIEAYLADNPIRADKIYISRQKTPRRQIENAAEIEGFLKSEGFTTIFAEELTLIEACAYFYQAKIIFSCHGAAFTHLLFCKPHTKIIEALPMGSLLNVFYWTLSDTKKLDYYYITGQPKDLNTNRFAKGHRSALFIKLEDLQQTLQLATT